MSAFWAGFSIGLGMFVASVTGIYLWLNPYPEPEFNVHLDSNGPEVSRQGGRKLVIRHEGGSLIQTCNGICDDLRYRGRDGEDIYFVSVLDASGESVIPERGLHVMGDSGALSAKFDIGGADRLEMKLQDRISELPWRPAEGVMPR